MIILREKSTNVALIAIGEPFTLVTGYEHVGFDSFRGNLLITAYCTL